MLVRIAGTQLAKMSVVAIGLIMLSSIHVFDLRIHPKPQVLVDKTKTAENSLRRGAFQTILETQPKWLRHHHGVNHL
jgi:hypothetical protein